MSTALSFDPLAFAKKLEDVGVPTIQAVAQAEALADVFQKVAEACADEPETSPLAAQEEHTPALPAPHAPTANS